MRTTTSGTTHRRRTLAAQQAGGERELAALVDGPWAPRWYWRDELEAMQRASRRMGYPGNHPSAVLRCYQPTEEFRPHPTEPDVTGRAWRYHRPAAGEPEQTTGVGGCRAPGKHYDHEAGDGEDCPARVAPRSGAGRAAP